MYRLKISIVVCVCALSGLIAAPHRSYSLEDKEAINHTFSGDKSLDIDNVNGFIHVIADTGNTIRVEGEKIIRANDQQQIQFAKREVTLDINEKEGVAQLYVNGPFRHNDRDSEGHGFHEHHTREYEVTYNFTVHIPRQTDLRLYTINGGDIAVEGSQGKFDVHNINGAVTMTGIAGAGTAATLNGPAKVSFRQNPGSPCDFKSLNGPVDVSFQPNLSADLRFKTLNGHVYTDFEVVSLPGGSAQAERRDGKFIYRSNQFNGVRAGSGGPELKFDTLNGDIHIRRQER